MEWSSLQHSRIGSLNKPITGFTSLGVISLSLAFSLCRSNEAYLTSLGRTIVNFARIIPEGLLVFFASYSVLNQCKAHWEETGIWNQIFSIKVFFLYDACMHSDFDRTFY